MTEAKSRRTTTIALLVLIVAAAAIGAVGYLRDDPEVDGDRVYLSTDGGAVLFEHAKHAAAAEACLDCHHDLAGDAVSCQDCHEDPDYEPDTVEHADLVEIHESACADCHEIAPDDEAESCRECHADEIADIYHRSCSACHLEAAADRFADASGEPKCAACHLR